MSGKLKLTGLAFFLLFTVSAFGQLGMEARADKYYNELAYAKAIKLYEASAKKGAVSDNLIFHLADSYHKVGDFKNAEVWYAQAVQKRARTPEMIYQYAQALKSNEKYWEANNWMRLYNEMVPEDQRGVIHVTAGDYVAKNTPIIPTYKVSNLSINTAASDFGAAFFNDNSVVFSSTDRTSPAIKREYAWRDEPYLDLFISDRIAGGGLNTPEEFSKALNSRLHEGMLCFTSDGLQVYFTRNSLNKKGRQVTSKKGVTNLKIYRATLAGGDFVNIEELPFNSNEYNVSSPSITHDGSRLYFASDQPGGYGGMDIYYIDIERGFFTKPINCGPAINTEGNENFPFIHRTNTLYFASDGKATLGGYDIYEAQLVRGVWKNVNNMGTPINSSKDDFSFVMDSAMTTGFLSSNRDGGKGNDDLYSFVRDIPAEVYSLQGVAYDENNLPVYNANVFIKDQGGKTINKAVTDRDGFFSFTLSRSRKYQLSAQSQFHLPVQMDIPVVPVGDVKSVSVIMDKANYTCMGVIRDDETSLPLGGTIVKVIKLSSFEEQQITTNMDGKFEFNLDPEGYYEIVALKPGYLNNKTSLATANRFSAEPIIVKDLNLSRLQVGLTFEIPTIYYDFGKADLRPESVDALLTVAEFMNNNPGVTIEIGAHTDSRAEAASNKDLSERRAQGCVDFLAQRGVTRSRMVAIGYGETQIRNKCVDGVKCTEEEHQYNRRTEVRILSVPSSSY